MPGGKAVRPYRNRDPRHRPRASENPYRGNPAAGYSRRRTAAQDLLMHELSIAQILVEQVVAAARKAGATRVIQVSVALGNLGTVNPDALAAAFPIAADHTFI